jgi:hypothetical protein
MRRLQMSALQAQQQRDMAELKIAQLLSSSSSSSRPPATWGIDLSEAHRERMRKLGFNPPQGDKTHEGGSDPASGPERRVRLAASSPLAQAGADLYRSHVQLILGGVDAARDRAATSLSSQGQHMVRTPFSPAPLLQRSKCTSQTQRHQTMYKAVHPHSVQLTQKHSFSASFLLSCPPHLVADSTRMHDVYFCIHTACRKGTLLLSLFLIPWPSVHHDRKYNVLHPHAPPTRPNVRGGASRGTTECLTRRYKGYN